MADAKGSNEMQVKDFDAVDGFWFEICQTVNPKIPGEREVRHQRREGRCENVAQPRLSEHQLQDGSFGGKSLLYASRGPPYAKRSEVPYVHEHRMERPVEKGGVSILSTTRCSPKELMGNEFISRSTRFVVPRSISRY